MLPRSGFILDFLLCCWMSSAVTFSNRRKLSIIKPNQYIYYGQVADDQSVHPTNDLQHPINNVIFALFIRIRVNNMKSSIIIFVQAVNYLSSFDELYATLLEPNKLLNCVLRFIVFFSILLFYSVIEKSVPIYFKIKITRNHTNWF